MPISGREGKVIHQHGKKFLHDTLGGPKSVFDISNVSSSKGIFKTIGLVIKKLLLTI